MFCCTPSWPRRPLAWHGYPMRLFGPTGHWGWPGRARPGYSKAKAPALGAKPAPGHQGLLFTFSMKTIVLSVAFKAVQPGSSRSPESLPVSYGYPRFSVPWTSLPPPATTYQSSRTQLSLLSVPRIRCSRTTPPSLYYCCHCACFPGDPLPHQSLLRL